MTEKALAAVRTAPEVTEVREYDIPDSPDDAALLKVEVAGICGTDVKFYSKPPIDDPVFELTTDQHQFHFVWPQCCFARLVLLH